MKTLAFLIREMQSAQTMIRYAALLAKDLKARVHIWHIQYPHVYGTHGYMGSAVTPDPEQLQEIADEVKKKVAGFVKEIEAEYSGIPTIEFKSEIGDASTILKEKVESNVYDMVMLQGHTEQGFLLQNSALMGIVRNIPCPVWIIPPDAKFKPLKKIIYATDYKEEDIATLKSLLETVKPFDPEITALHISNDDEFEKKLKSEGFAEMLCKETGSTKITVKMIADEDGNDAVEVLAGEAEKAKTNLIVVLKENKNFFERLFKSSFTAELVKQTQLPVLVFHQTK
jgi:nucleotide-binding universal stress UspA family protein